MTEFDKVAEFNEKFMPDAVSQETGFPSNEVVRTKLVHLREELAEIEKSVETRDAEELFDGLIDIVYVALGFAYFARFPFNEGFDRVHAANMKKVRVESESQSKRSSKYDVRKPINWKKPDLKSLL